MNSVNSVIGNVIENKCNRCKLNEIIVILVRCYTGLCISYTFYNTNC